MKNLKSEQKSKNNDWRGVAQLGRVRGSGLRGRKFKSCHPDQKRFHTE